MIVLSRNANQSIFIGDYVKLTVLGSKHGQVRFGIEAPEDIKIWREEIYRKIQEEKEIQEFGIEAPEDIKICREEIYRKIQEEKEIQKLEGSLTDL